MLTAQAHVADLETQAHLAKMLAAELRQEAAKLAHQNTSAEAERGIDTQSPEPNTTSAFAPIGAKNDTQVIHLALESLSERAGLCACGLPL